MIEAKWNGAVIAQADDTVVVEGNHYFARDTVDAAVLEPSTTTSECPWKGTAHYYSVRVDDTLNADAAWYYPDPKPAAGQIKDRIAFWKGVTVA